MPGKYSEETKQRAVELVRGGATLAQAAEAVDCGTTAVWEWCKRAGVAPPNGGGAGGRGRRGTYSPTSRVSQAIALMEAEGIGATGAGRRIGVSASAINQARSTRAARAEAELAKVAIAMGEKGLEVVKLTEREEGDET